MDGYHQSCQQGSLRVEQRRAESGYCFLFEFDGRRDIGVSGAELWHPTASQALESSRCRYADPSIRYGALASENPCGKWGIIGAPGWFHLGDAPEWPGGTGIVTI
jgi:hypothetical protein